VLLSFGGDKLIRHNALGDVVTEFINHAGFKTNREVNRFGIYSAWAA
jgi:hypothetical protein